MKFEMKFYINFWRKDMNILESFASWSLIPIFFIFFNVKVTGRKHFKICFISLMFVIFLKFFFFDYHDFPITKMIYLFFVLYSLQILLEWKWLLKIMGIISDKE